MTGPTQRETDAATQRRDHWERVYLSRPADSVSWFQQNPEPSLTWIRALGLPQSAAIIDVGGGASVLVDALLDDGYRAVSVLDVSGAALERARLRLGANAARARWIVADVLCGPPSHGRVDVWHDRAVFHFLTTPAERAAYLAHLRATLRPGGHVVLACFAIDGPTRCSGLPVVRYDTTNLAA